MGQGALWGNPSAEGFPMHWRQRWLDIYKCKVRYYRHPTFYSGLLISVPGNLFPLLLKTESCDH